MRIMRGSKPVGYTLTDDGWDLVKDLLNALPARCGRRDRRPNARGPGANPSFLWSHGRAVLDGHHRLEQIASREAELTTELDALHQERDTICNRLANEEVHRLLAGLLEIRPAAENGEPTPAR